jgi:hypothetical protein
MWSTGFRFGSTQAAYVIPDDIEEDFWMAIS